MMFVLGICGSPAGGKSTVAKTLQEWGAEWINADNIARDLLNTTEVTSELVDRFGNEVLAADGRVCRKTLANRVFGSDPESQAALADLESIVHPRVRVVIRKRIAVAASKQTDFALLDVPLLFESGWDRSCDAIWCVDASRENRLQRAASRGWDSAELDRREANQMPINEKCRLSNLVMRNDSTLAALRENLRFQWDLLVRIRPSATRSERDLASNHCLSDWSTND